MSRRIHKITVMVIALVLTFALCSCGDASEVPIDYGDAESFEAALNAGENLEGKVVRFTALELHPDSSVGYNIWAGEHLNFVSRRNPDIKAGDTVVVRATEITSSLGSWFIEYEEVSDAEITDTTISADGSAGDGGKEDSEQDNAAETSTDTGNGSSGNTASSAVEDGSISEQLTPEDTDTTMSTAGPASEQLPLEITDYGWYMNEPSSYDDSAYIDFCTMIHNPNENLIAEFPKAIVTVKGGDGRIFATEEQTGSIIMPGDTVTLCGMFSMPVADISDNTQIIFDVDWRDLVSENTLYDAVRTTDFTFSNVSEISSSDENLITGEITNNSAIDLDIVNLSIVLRKDGKIVYMESTFADNLKAGKTKAFELQRYQSWPEHDTIECSAMVW